MNKLMLVFSLCTAAAVPKTYAGVSEDLDRYKRVYEQERKSRPELIARWDLDEKYEAALNRLIKQGEDAGDLDGVARVRAEVTAIDAESGAQRAAWRENTRLYHQYLDTLSKENTTLSPEKRAQAQRRLTQCRNEIADVQKNLDALPKTGSQRTGTLHYESSPAGALKRVHDDKGKVVEEMQHDSGGRMTSRVEYDGRREALAKAQQGARWRGKLMALQREEKELTALPDPAQGGPTAKPADQLAKVYKEVQLQILRGESPTSEKISEYYAVVMAQH